MFNVLRVRKIRTLDQVTNTENHNFRKNQNLDNVHYDKINDNFYLTGDKDSNLNFLFDYAKEKLKFKYREDQNKMVEVVFSASPEFFKNKTRDQIIEYFSDCEKVLKKIYPGLVGLSHVIHFDEKTPHSHFIFLPIEKREKIVSKGKFKGETKKYYSLSFESYFGNKNFIQDGIHKNKMSWLQTKFHQIIQTKYKNLMRGKFYSETNRKNKKPSEQIEDLSNENKELQNQINRLYEELDELEIENKKLNTMNDHYKNKILMDDINSKIKPKKSFKETYKKGFK